ncbi:hypothetical protein IX46_00445 [Buchnera aphidicola (Aphis glycines)]|uniref:Translocation/assembly module TamB n=1 Tax=Buchnera aphidicola (Aphis glycines) TaxID=1265350 RepID=A0A0M3RS88_9GAMM|nr:hypothetical protein [Buchnera aphidicola]ALD15050.1 hypothetical protein IX46_00445 [Buchnera aphidicola (Aphis glycines)]
MNVYQRYLSKSLILFASLLFLIILLLESNFGFKLFFNITNYCFLGFKTEKVSGNWRDFTLKNITFNFFHASIKASRIHILIDPKSLLSAHKILKNIEIKNLIFSFNENHLFSSKKNYFKKNPLEKNIFFNNYVIVKNIHFDKILLKSKNTHIILLNVYSGLKFINNNFTILDTYVDYAAFNYKKYNQKIFLNTKKIINKKKINNFLSFFLDHKQFAFPMNLNFISIKCKKIQVFQNQFKNVFFQGIINKKFIFKLKFNDFFKFNIFGKVLLNNLYHPIYIHLYTHRFLFPVKKNITFISKNFNVILKGTVDNYYLSFKNIINISGMPSVFLNVFCNGNLTNISVNKIYFIPISNDKKLVDLKKQTYIQYISKLTGNVNISKNVNSRVNSINISHFNLKSNIINKKFLVSGSLNYNQISNVKIPKISFFLGKNKGFVQGSVSKLINLDSSINANNLNDFIPDLKGAIISTLNIYGYYFSPVISGVISGEKLNWNNIIYLKKMKILFNVNTQQNTTKNVFLSIKNINLSKFCLDYLNIKLYWNDIKQKFCFFMKNKNFNINFVINGKLNHHKKIWKGIFKKINISTFNQKWNFNKRPIIFAFNKNTKKNKYNTVKYKRYIFSLIKKVKKFLFLSIFNSSINFKTNLFFQTTCISNKINKFSNIKIFLYSKNTTLYKKIKNKIFSKKISFLKFLINLKKNNLTTRLVIYPSKNKNNKLFGFLNIYDIFHKQHIQGKYFLLHFPCSILNFFIAHPTAINGKCSGKIHVLHTLYQPHILADMHLKNFYIKSNKILKYIMLFFYPSLNLVKHIKINQSIFIKQGNVLFQLYLNSKNKIVNSTEWNIFFSSNQVFFFILPKIKLNLSSQLNLHYFLLKYDLIGYLKSFLFNFHINEKNFIF